MASAPLSIRFDTALLDRLRDAARTQGTTSSGLAQRLVDEGLTMAEFPGIVFRDGPAGRRAGLVAGPDVWEVVGAIRTSDARNDGAVAVAASEFDLPRSVVQTALAYYGAHPDEVDSMIAANERAAAAALRAWEAQQRLLA